MIYLRRLTPLVSLGVLFTAMVGCGGEDMAVVTGDTTGAVTEDAAVNTATGLLSILVEREAGDEIFFSSVIAAESENGYGSVDYAEGTWTYTLDNTNTTVNELAAGEDISDAYTFEHEIGSSQEITIRITGADDSAVITGDIIGSVTEDDEVNTVTGALSISDVDSNTPSFSDLAPTESDNGYGTMAITAGTWTYTLDNTDETVDALAEGVELIDTYTFVADDGSEQEVTITIIGYDDTGTLPSLSLQWESAASLQVPESVRFDAEREVLYVTNIIGAPWGIDGNASIARVALDGTVLDANWISGAETGLNAPKGIAIYDGHLYVADLSNIAVISISDAEVVDNISVTGASGLNDISIDATGNIYVTDSFTGILTLIEGGFQTALVTGHTGLNGVYVEGTNLYFLSSGGLYATDTLGTDPRLITSNFEGSPDGVEKIADGTWLVTSWEGITYVVQEDIATEEVHVTTVLDTRAQEVYSADLGYNPETRTAYLPTFFGNTVQAFQLDLGE